jgi:hypothetical protein
MPDDRLKAQDAAQRGHRLYGSLPATPARVLTDAEVEAMEAERGQKEEPDGDDR